MNWIRDNILKIILGIFAIIIIAIVIVACSMGGGTGTDNSSGYIALENKIQAAARKYASEHPSVLPKSTDTIKKINADTLIEAGKMGKLYSPDNKNVVCKGHVEIEKLSEEEKEYRFTPYISCGKYYITKTIADYIKDKETENGEFNRTTNDGLYSIDDEYVFKGEYPDNFLLLGNRLYRIVKIDSENRLELISTVKTMDYYIWDDRYNVDKNQNIGINDFAKSRLFESLKIIYENIDANIAEVYFSDVERAYIEEHDFCIGKRDINDNNIYSGVECSSTIPMKVGLISVNEYARASIDPNCKGIMDRSCANYNFFTKINTKNESSIATLTAAANDTYTFYKVSYGETLTLRTGTSSSLYPVIYIRDKVIYKSGSGTYLDPYIVR